MFSNKQSRLLSIYNYVFLVLTVILGSSLILKTIDIYNAGIKKNTQIFSPQVIAEGFKAILPIIIIWALSVVIGVVLNKKFSDLTPNKNRLPVYMIKNTLDSKIEVLPVNIRKMTKMLFVLRSIATVLVIVVSVFPILYFLDFSNFAGKEITDEVKKSIIFTLPFAFAVFIIAIVYVVIRDILLNNIITAQREYIKSNGISKLTKKECKKTSVNYLRIFLLCIGLILFIIGIFNGGINEVLTKATKICTECIGLG